MKKINSTSIDDIKKSAIKLYNKIVDWLNTKGKHSYNTNGVILSYISTIFVIIAMLLLSCIGITESAVSQYSSNSNSEEEFTETVEVIVISATETTGSNGAVKYKTVLKYLNKKYTFTGYKTYSKCKGMDGLKIEWDIEITIDKDGDISYGLVDLDKD